MKATGPDSRGKCSRKFIDICFFLLPSVPPSNRRKHCYKKGKKHFQWKAKNKHKYVYNRDTIIALTAVVTLISTVSTRSLSLVTGEGRSSGGRGSLGSVLRSRGGVSLPHTSCSDSLPVVLDGHDKENQQGDTLDTSQEEEVIVQLAFIDVTCKTYKGISLDNQTDI